MTIATRVGDLVVLEYLDKWQEHLLYDSGLTERELKQRAVLESVRSEAFAELRKTYEKVLRGEYDPKDDALSLEFDKYRNGNSMNHIHLGL